MLCNGSPGLLLICSCSLSVSSISRQNSSQLADYPSHQLLPLLKTKRLRIFLLTLTPPAICRRSLLRSTSTQVVECFRRIALTGFAVFIYPDSSAQIAIVLLLAAIFMVLSEILSPFARPTEMWLYRAGHYVVFASMYLALLLRVDVSSERDQSQDVSFSFWVVLEATVPYRAGQLNRTVSLGNQTIPF